MSLFFHPPTPPTPVNLCRTMDVGMVNYMCANDKVTSTGWKACVQTTRFHRLIERHVCKQQGCYIDWLKDMYANNKVTSTGWKTCMQTTRLHRLVERHVCKRYGFIDWLRNMHANDKVSSTGWETFEIMNIKPAVAVFYSRRALSFMFSAPRCWGVALRPQTPWA